MNKLLFILPLLFLVTMATVYADHIQDLRQGTATCTDPSNCPPQASAFLEWCIDYIDGSECGKSQGFVTNFYQIPFTFFDTTDKTRTLIKATVFPKTDYSKMGEIYCVQDPSWTSSQTITINGVEHELPKHFGVAPEEFNDQTKIHTGFPLQFTPSLLVRLLDDKGVLLNTGDEFIWTTHWRSGYFIVEGQIVNPVDGMGACNTADDIHGIAVGYNAVTVGLSSQMKFIWVDPDELINPDDPSNFDADGDGVTDEFDLCDFSPEVFNGFKDDDGCPDEIIIDDHIPDPNLDRDGDGIVDSIDICDLQPETFNNYLDADGCPDVNPDDIPDPVDTPIPEKCTACNAVWDPDSQQCYFLGAPCSDPDPDPEVQVDEDEDEPTVDNGDTLICNNAVDNCEEVVDDFITGDTVGTGIALPFEPTVLNLMLFFGGISAIIVTIVLVARR